MIFTSLGLLVVALVFLIAGILRSAVGLLVLSVVCTLVACAVLYASFVAYRRKALDEAGKAEGPLVEPGWPQAYAPEAAGTPAGTVAPVVVAPVPAPSSGLSLGPTATNGQGSHEQLLERWEGLNATEAARLTEGLDLDELHAVRRHEVENDNRKTVLRAIDSRIDVVVELRRSLKA